MSYIRLNTVIEPAAPATNKVVLYAGTDKVLKTKDDTGLVTPLVGDLSNAITVTTTGAIATLPIPSGSGDLLVLMNNASLATIHGITPGLNGQRLTILGNNAQVDLSHLSASAGAPTQRLSNVATSAPTSITLRGSATYQYSTVLGYWPMVAHEQGAWITAPYSAANFSSNLGATWAVDSGDVLALRYQLSGRMVSLHVLLVSTTVSSSAPTFLRIHKDAFGGFTFAGEITGSIGYLSDAGTVVSGYFGVSAITYLTINKHAGTFTSPSTNATHIQGQIFFDVT